MEERKRNILQKCSRKSTHLALYSKLAEHVSGARGCRGRERGGATGLLCRTSLREEGWRHRHLTDANLGQLAVPSALWSHC